MHTGDHLLSRLDDILLVTDLFHIAPSRTYHADERHQCLLGRYQDILLERFTPDIIVKALGQLQRSVNRDIHQHIVKAFPARSDITAIILLGQIIYLALDCLQVKLRGSITFLFTFSLVRPVRKGLQVHLGVHDDIGIVREMDYHIRSHTFAAVLIRYDHP